MRQANYLIFSTIALLLMPQVSFAAPDISKGEVLKQVELKKWDWHKGGFDSIMLINGTVQNNSPVAIKDFTVRCDSSTNSGTSIDRNQKVVYELIQPSKKYRLRDFSMGFVHSQATKTNCMITDLVIVK